MTDVSVFSQPFQFEDLSWDLTPVDGGFVIAGVLDTSLLTANQHYPNGYLKSGFVLGKLTSTGLWGPYSGTTDEVQTVTEGGSGLTSFTLTFSGQTTGSIAAAATNATVQAALEALSNIGVGNVLVTGANGGPYTVTFRGTLADTDVAQMTATPTGGTGTVTVATTTAGGADASADGRQVAIGILRASVRVTRYGDGSVIPKVGVAALVHGKVDPTKLPYTAANAPIGGFLDAAAKTDLPLIYFGA